MRSPLRAIAAAQHGAFSARQAVTCYSPRELRSRVSAGRWLPVHERTYRCRTSEPNARLRLAAAAVLSIGRPVPACLHTAAELHGFGVLDDPVTHVAVGTDLPCRHRDGLWPHQLALAPRDVVTLRCGATRHLRRPHRRRPRPPAPRLDVLPVLDAASAAGVCTPESLAAEVERHAGLRGVRQARELIPLADHRPESPQESRLRLRCHDAGLPPPTLQLPVPDARGKACRWIDLGWEEVKVGIEYDGEQYHDDTPDRRRSDRRRHNFLQDDGWSMFYATDLDVYRDFGDLMAKVGAAIDRRSRR
ncbi:hypothetical protein [Pseudonocardia nigra]|uniref:hypothetical protein n=1 Tax=Pseudonocardia nigra TaxID=1921578 RepID=UPI001C5E9486|nr:hypothetical protein [Pseudonocardia nigra]